MKNIFKKLPSLPTGMIILIVILLVTLLFKNQEKFFSNSASPIIFTPVIITDNGSDATGDIVQNPIGTFNLINNSRRPNIVSKQGYNSVTITFKISNMFSGGIGLFSSKNGYTSLPKTSPPSVFVFNNSIKNSNNYCSVLTPKFIMKILPSSTLKIVSDSIVGGQVPASSTWTQITSLETFKIVYNGSTVSFYINDILANTDTLAPPVYFLGTMHSKDNKIKELTVVDTSVSGPSPPINKEPTCPDSILKYKTLFKNPTFKTFF